jgi:hypothetical protein
LYVVHLFVPKSQVVRVCWLRGRAKGVQVDGEVAIFIKTC